jgi:hypothetical protein
MVWALQWPTILDCPARMKIFNLPLESAALASDVKATSDSTRAAAANITLTEILFLVFILFSTIY